MTNSAPGYSVLLFICSITLAVLVLSVSGLYAGTKKVDAGKIYVNHCAKCHGKLGKPTKRGVGLGAPSFSDHSWQASITDEQIIEAITHGKKKMPGWRKVLNPEEIKAAARWVRVFDKKRR